MPETMLRRDAVEKIVGLSTTTLYRQMAEGEFPRPVRIGRRAVAWPESVITKWQDERPLATERQAVAA